MWMARPMIESMIDEADQYSDEASIDEDGKADDSPRKKFEKWARSCRNPNAMAAAAAVAKANPVMRIDLKRCDADPMWINTRNGVYDAGDRVLPRAPPRPAAHHEGGRPLRPRRHLPALGRVPRAGAARGGDAGSTCTGSGATP